MIDLDAAKKNLEEFQDVHYNIGEHELACLFRDAIAEIARLREALKKDRKELLLYKSWYNGACATEKELEATSSRELQEEGLIPKEKED